MKLQLTERDYGLLQTLARGPLTINQIMRCSNRFAQPFENYDRLRQRLTKTGRLAQ